MWSSRLSGMALLERQSAAEEEESMSQSTTGPFSNGSSSVGSPKIETLPQNTINRGYLPFSPSESMQFHQNVPVNGQFVYENSPFI